MALTPGERLGPYEILSAIDVGGMGEVYRARDTKLGRDVAIKILPELFASDLERVARFDREAKTLAALNHPNIAQIFGIEEWNATPALVMELVEGETVADRIARGPIAIDEALPIAKQIAEALEAAHEQGIIHRDVKPANIKVRPDGTVKVLDFGLAKLAEPTSATTNPAALSMSPTITSPALVSGVGVLIGTAAYMSPEQARGKTVDKRADIWAFGAVLFEMLAAHRAFDDEDVSMTLSKILQREPAFEALPLSIPARVTQAIRVCLRKDPKQRAGDIRDVRLALEGAFETVAPRAVASPAPFLKSARLAWIVASTAAIVAAALAVPALRYLREIPPPETRVDIMTPATEEPTSFALSPDGRQIVFAASDNGTSRLWLRSLATAAAQPLTGTEGATYPFWSPDGRSIGFFAQGLLKRLDLGAGTPQILAPAIPGLGGTWNADGIIVFAPSRISELMRVSATGGAAVAVTTRGPRAGARFPHFLPDGRHFVFSVAGSPDIAGVYLGSLAGGAPTRLMSEGYGAVPLPTGWLVWVRGGTLLAQRMDVDRAALVGEPATVADGVAADLNGQSALAVSNAGLVAFRTGGETRSQLTWFDRAGTARGTFGDVDVSLAGSPRLSPDHRRVAVNRIVANNIDVWLLDGTRASRFTFDAAADLFPVWSPDGTRIVFRSNRSGSPGDLYEKGTTATRAEERFVTSDQTKSATSWSPDGRFVLYSSTDPKTGTDLWVVPMVGDRTPSVFLKTAFRETMGAFSPDGRWVAYQSDETGRPEIYVRPFVPPSRDAPADRHQGQWQVSTAGGIAPAWRPDGREIYFIDPSGAMMAAPIAVTGATLEPGAPVVLFSTRITGGGVDTGAGRGYDIASDGRFLIDTVLEQPAAPITLIQNLNFEARK